VVYYGPDHKLHKFGIILLRLTHVVQFLGLVLCQLSVLLSHNAEASFTDLENNFLCINTCSLY